MRWLRHLFTTRWQLRAAFAPATLDAIETAISASEKHQRGELRFVLEGALDPTQLWQRLTPRQRALQLFAELGVWDTAENCGVLVYVLLAERAVEIVADRGYASRVDPAVWRACCAEMTAHFARDEFKQGALVAISRLADIMAEHFPGDGSDPNELPNRPTLL